MVVVLAAFAAKFSVARELPVPGVARVLQENSIAAINHHMCLLQTPIDELVGFLALTKVLLVAALLEPGQTSDMILVPHWQRADALRRAREWDFSRSGQGPAVLLDDEQIRDGNVSFSLSAHTVLKKILRPVERRASLLVGARTPTAPLQSHLERGILA